MNALNTASTAYESQSNQNIVRLDTSRQSAFGNVKIGDIITATLTENDGKKAAFTLENGKSFFADAKSVVAEIGQKVSFEVADVHGNSVVMKQINDNKDEEIERSEKDLSGEKLLNWAKGSVLPITGAAFASSKIMFEQSAEQDMKMLEALSKIKKDISTVVNGVSGGVLSLFARNGISLENVTVTMLTEAIKTAVLPLNEAYCQESDVTAALEEYSKNNSSQKYQELLQAVTAILEEDLPVTEANIDAVAGITEKAKEAAGMRDEDKISFLKKQQQPTVGNLFTAIHSAGSQKQPRTMSDKQWDEMRQGVEKYMDSAGIEKSAKNLSAARLLIANEVPVTKESVDFMTGALKQKDASLLIKEAARSISEGRSPLSLHLFEDMEAAGTNPKQLLNSYKEIIKELPKITDSAIEQALESGATVTIASLLEANRNVSASGDGSEANEEEPEKDRGRITKTRITLEEIRLRLTITAASQMSKAGIAIDATQLQSALEQLKELERRNNEAALRIAGVPTTEQNLAAMSERADRFRALSNTYDSVKSRLLNRELEFTAEKIAEANLRVREEAAKSGYEAMETAPNAKFGDSVQKALRHVENLLETMGIEALPENIKAARSLVRTGTDVTKENIEAIKAINNKIENVTQSLHPIISASMIRDGFNPLTAHIDEVIAYINKYNELNGTQPVKSIEKEIFNMDKNGELSSEERAALIGMYRMLSAINGHETAASAVIAKSGKSLTLENLMEAGKYYDKSKAKRRIIDDMADDAAGNREIIANSGSIREQIAQGYRDGLKKLGELGITEQQAEQAAAEGSFGPTEESMELLEAALRTDTDFSRESLNRVYNLKCDVEKLARGMADGTGLDYLKTIGDAENKDIRELLSEMNEFIEKNSLNEARRNMSEQAEFSAFKEDLKSLASVSPQQLAWLMAMNLPLTVGNIKTTCGAAGDRDYFSKRLEELNRLAENISGIRIDDEIPDTELKELVESADADKIYDGIEEKINEIIDKAIEADAPEKVELLRQATIVENASKLMSKTKNSFFQIPMKLHDKTGSLNVFILNQNADNRNMSAFIQLNLTELGTVQANVNINDGFADIVIGAEDSESIKRLQASSGLLEGYIGELGLKDYNISFSLESNTDYFESFGDTALAAGVAGAGQASESELDIKL